MKTTKEIREDLNYLFSKIDWKKSFLDAKAITIMNEIGKDIQELEHYKNDIIPIMEQTQKAERERILEILKSGKSILTILREIEKEIKKL